jgi:UDP-glucuronate 4-epimerase
LSATAPDDQLELERLFIAIITHADIELGPGTDPVDEVQRRFDISAAARDLDFQPALTFDQWAAEYAEWLRARKLAAREA